jgi:hypothetical protein
MTAWRHLSGGWWNRPEWFVAAGTLLLAIYTAVLARHTKRAVVVSTRELQAQQRPTLVDVEPDPESQIAVVFPRLESRKNVNPTEIYNNRTDAEWLVGIGLRNIGPGPAFIDESPLLVTPGTRHVEAGAVHRKIVPATETTFVMFSVDVATAGADFLAGLESGRFDMVIPYADEARALERESRVEIERSLRGELRVQRCLVK